MHLVMRDRATLAAFNTHEHPSCCGSTMKTGVHQWRSGFSEGCQTWNKGHKNISLPAAGEKNISISRHEHESPASLLRVSNIVQPLNERWLQGFLEKSGCRRQTGARGCVETPTERKMVGGPSQLFSSLSPSGAELQEWRDVQKVHGSTSGGGAGRPQYCSVIPPASTRVSVRHSPGFSAPTGIRRVRV